MKRRAWGMTATLIAGILNIPSLPFGTAAGIYALWVYFRERDEPRPVMI
jgi:hypothetical protein